MRLGSWVAALGSVVVLGGASLAAPPGGGQIGKSIGESIEAVFGPRVRVVKDSLSGAVRGLFGLEVPTAGATPEARALAFIAGAKKTLGLETVVLVTSGVQPLATGGHVVTLAQTALGVPVEGRSLAVKLDADGDVRSVTSDVVPFELARPATTIAPEAAREAVRRAFDVALVGRPIEVVLASAPGLARLAWKVPAAVIPLQAHFFVWIDAETGAVLREAPAGLDQVLTRLPKKEAP